MWVVVKTKKNCVIKNLKVNLKKIFSFEPLIYSPKILQQIVIGNKYIERNHYILGNYIIIFHEKLNDKFYLITLFY